MKVWANKRASMSPHAKDPSGQFVRLTINAWPRYICEYQTMIQFNSVYVDMPIMNYKVLSRKSQCIIYISDNGTPYDEIQSVDTLNACYSIFTLSSVRYDSQTPMPHPGVKSYITESNKRNRRCLPTPNMCTDNRLYLNENVILLFRDDNETRVTPGGFHLSTSAVFGSILPLASYDTQPLLHIRRMRMQIL